MQKTTAVAATTKTQPGSVRRMPTEPTCCCIRLQWIWSLFLDHTQVHSILEREGGGKLSKMIGLLVYFSQKLKIITVNSESQENLPSDLPSKAGWRKAFMLAFGIAFSLVKTPVCFSSLWGSCHFGQAGTKPGM